MLKRRLLAVCTGAILALGLLPALTTAAKADVPPPGCTSGALCAYVHVNYAYGPYRFFGTNSSWHRWYIADRDSSWFNNGTTGRAARVFQHVNWGGAVEVCVDRGDGIPNQWWRDDMGSSNDWPWPWYC
jgi:Peptidase inhibitor family I36